MTFKKFSSKPFTAEIIFSAVVIMLTSCNKPPTKLFNVYVSDDERSQTANQNPSVVKKDPLVIPKDPPAKTTDKIPSDTKPTEEKPSDPVVVAPNPKPDPIPTPSPTPTPAPEIPEVEECTNKLSVGRIYQWIATSEGQMIPSSGTIVVKENGKNVAKVKFIGNEWHVLPTWLKNTYDAEVDLSASKGFTLTYSATADLYLQLRPSFAWSGGDKYLVKIPSTAGVSKSLTVDFKEASWTTLDSLGKPPYPLSMAVKQARGFVFVGNVPNDFAVTGLTIDGYSPPCP